MNAHRPPKLAIYLLNRFASSYHRDSLAGDLIEQFHGGRSTRWFWRQVLSAIFAARVRAIESARLSSTAKKVLRVINAIMLAAAIALGVGTLTRADSPPTGCLLQVRC